jgi:HSP20 family molecular chaperone IbpA
LSRSASSASSMPAPEAPVILMPSLQNENSGDDAQRRAPYDSFLCHAPLPNTWIAVETSHSEYRLLVRLPGFRRDGITIATRRRRILHVVADSWEPGGGHFERRVSFGYDADLAQVRAEFDGDLLRIVVPRRPLAGNY